MKNKPSVKEEVDKFFEDHKKEEETFFNRKQNKGVSDEEIKQAIAELYGYADWFQVGMTEDEDADDKEYCMNQEFVLFKSILSKLQNIEGVKDTNIEVAMKDLKGNNDLVWRTNTDGCKLTGGICDCDHKSGCIKIPLKE